MVPFHCLCDVILKKSTKVFAEYRRIPRVVKLGKEISKNGVRWEEVSSTVGCKKSLSLLANLQVQNPSNEFLGQKLHLGGNSNLISVDVICKNFGSPI